MLHGATFDPSGKATRRQFLTALAGAGGLQRAVERTADRPVDGVPVVWTRDRFGVPDRVRAVSAERHRRLRVYATLDVGALRDRCAALCAVTLTGPANGADLALSAAVERDGFRVRRKLPNRVREVPLSVRRRDGSPEPRSVCRAHVTDFYDPIEANVEVNGIDADGGMTGTGTLGLVAWDARAPGGHCLVTAHHVVSFESGRTAPYLRHEGRVGDRQMTAVVGELRAQSPIGPGGMDGAKYAATGPVGAAPRSTASDRQPDVSGTWDFLGLADATAAGRIPVSFAGRSTCFARSYCTGTERNSFVEYAAVVDSGVASNGDSGGPYVDGNGRLVGIASIGDAGDGEWDAGPVGTELLDRLGVRLWSGDELSPPGSGPGSTPGA